MPDRIQIQREDAGEDMELRVPEPVTVFYGKHFHCPNCSAGYQNPEPHDPYHVCSYCTQVVDLRSMMRAVNPYVEHGPPVTPAA